MKKSNRQKLQTKIEKFTFDEIEQKLLQFELGQPMKITNDWQLIFGYWNNFLLSHEYEGVQTIRNFLMIYHRPKKDNKKFNDMCDKALDYLNNKKKSNKS